jgi:two-component system sensor histidine kinase PrrB
VRNAITHGRASRIVLTANRHGDLVDIIVDDNGRGLPAEEHRVVLGRFARGSTASAGGSGLGLALVAQQAALHDGSIELSHGPLGGLRAKLTVSIRSGPKSDPSIPRRAPASRAAKSPSPSKRRSRK